MVWKDSLKKSYNWILVAVSVCAKNDYILRYSESVAPVYPPNIILMD